MHFLTKLLFFLQNVLRELEHKKPQLDELVKTAENLRESPIKQQIPDKGELKFEVAWLKSDLNSFAIQSNDYEETFWRHERSYGVYTCFTLVCKIILDVFFASSR